MSECALNVIIKMRAGMCMNALYVLLEREFFCVSMRFIWYYKIGHLYVWIRV